MSEKSRWQVEFDTLPRWAQLLVLSLQHLKAHSIGDADWPSSQGRRDQQVCLVFAREQAMDALDALDSAAELARALTAPWPPPDPATAKPGHNSFNIVEAVAGEDDDADVAFDQPCVFGCRVDTHAVYCHNEGWPNAPRKCRRNRTDYRHEDCPGYVPNSAMNEEMSKYEWPG